MLWKKESNKPNALFVDIFAKSSVDLEHVFNEVFGKETNPHPQKDDAIALQKRTDGNAAFRRKAYTHAMELYNDCLRFATPGSEHISLAYANRAACFLKLKMFEKCLNDIKLAKEANYPAHLMPKLDQRKTECLEQLGNGASHHADIGDELSFEPNENFPSMANVLKVQQNHQSGKCMVVAKQDIDVGQTIVVEEAMFPYMSKPSGLNCSICLKANENLVPCKACAVASFCPDCQGHFLHEYECGLNVCGEGTMNREAMSEVRTILMTIKMFPTADELMAFIERIQQNTKLPTDLTDFQTKYQVYHNNCNRRVDIFATDIKLLAMKIYCVYRTILQVPQIKAMFQSRRHLRFLMHLIGHTSLIFQCSIRTIENGTTNAVFVDGNQIHVGSIEFESHGNTFCGVYPILKYMQHSCYPNALNIHANGKMVMITARPIKKGEQVFKSSIPVHIESKSERQHYVPECECPRCSGVFASADQRMELSSEPAFVELMEKLSGNDEQIGKTIKNCEILLQKYGRMDWCDEMKMLLTNYCTCLQTRITKG